MSKDESAMQQFKEVWEVISSKGFQIGNDKLTHDERVRLECIAQAIKANGGGYHPNQAKGILHLANFFYAWIINGNLTDIDF